EAEEAEAFALEPCVAPAMMLGCQFSMLATVHFNNEPGLVTNEVDDVGANGLLPAELHAQLLHAEDRPEATLRLGHVVAQRARSRRGHRTRPHTGASPSTTARRMTRPRPR